MTTLMTIKIKKMHIGRPVDFKLSDGEIINGRIAKVAHKIATIEYWLPIYNNTEPFITYLETNSTKIVEVY